MFLVRRLLFVAPVSMTREIGEGDMQTRNNGARGGRGLSGQCSTDVAQEALKHRLADGLQ
jgi:hypothetical protein